MDFSECHFRNVMQQKVMYVCYRNGNLLDYKHQEIYRNERSFRFAMLELMKQKIIEQLKTEEFYDQYRLTREGLFYVKNIILK